MKRNERGIFCIDGATSAGTASKVYSFKHTLEFLKRDCDFPALHRPVDTRVQLINQLKKWGTRDDSMYPILHLWFHGSDRGIFVNDPKGPGYNRLDLRDIASVVADKYDLEGTLIHFSACSTLAVDVNEIRKFFRASGVSAISGFKADVWFFESLSFELLFLNTLQDILTNGRGGKGGVTPELMHQVRERLLDSRKCRGLIDALGFKMVISDDNEL